MIGLIPAATRPAAAIEQHHIAARRMFSGQNLADQRGIESGIPSRYFF